MKTAAPGGFSFTSLYTILPPVHNFYWQLWLRSCQCVPLHWQLSQKHWQLYKTTMATVKFYLDKERKNGSLILATFTFNHER